MQIHIRAHGRFVTLSILGRRDQVPMSVELTRPQVAELIRHLQSAKKSESAVVTYDIK